MKLTNQVLSFDNSIILNYHIRSHLHRVIFFLCSRHDSISISTSRGTMLDPWVPQVQTVIQALQETPLEQLQVMIEEVIPLELMSSADFLHALCLNESTMVPRQLQLQAALAELAGFDSTLMSGTGSGKTLAIAIPHTCMGASSDHLVLCSFVTEVNGSMYFNNA